MPAITVQRFTTGAMFLALIGLLLLFAPTLSGQVPSPTDLVVEGTTYHVRMLRARWAPGSSGSALFRSDEIVIPLAEREPWGQPEQLESLRRSLGAQQIEPLPGLVIQAGPTQEGESHWFRTALGEELLEISFLAEELPEGWHRLQVAAWGERGAEILDAAIRVQADQTVVLVSPFGPEGEALVLAATPMLRSPDLQEGVHLAGSDGLTYPRLVEATKLQPRYPARARELLQSGKVILETVVRADGTLDGTVVLQMPEGGEWLAGAAVEAINQWRYEPATTADGTPVDVYFTIVVEFQLK